MTFAWSAPSTGRFVIDTFGSEFDTTVSVLEGSCSGGLRSCTDDTNGVQSRVDLDASAGERFVIVLGGYDGTATGAYVLSITQPPVSTETGLCDDDRDDDRDGATDCADDDCLSDAACIESLCNDGVDNDGDSAADCNDSDCVADAACIESLCTDGVDNDGDSAIDCRDRDCRRDAACIEAICNDGVDNDGDSAVDCGDFDCRRDPGGDPTCPPGRPECTLTIAGPTELTLDCGCGLQPIRLFGFDLRMCRLSGAPDPADETIPLSCAGVTLISPTGCEAP